MGSVSKRPGGRWRARYRDVAGTEHAKHFARRADAQRWLNSVTASVVRGEYVDPRASTVTVGEYAASWMAGRVHLKPKTRVGYESLLRTRILPSWGSVSLGRVTFEGVAAWVAEMASEGLSASRTRQAYHLFSSILDDAVKGSRLGRNPATGVELPRMIERPRRYLTHGQVADLADSAGESRTLILVLAYCGLRWGEVVALRVGRVDPLRGRLEVVEAVADVSGRLVLGSPKSHQHRSVPVPGFLRDELTAAMAGKNVDDLVFTSPEGAMLRGPNFRRHTFDDACRAAGLDGLTPHELRHTAASLAIAAGASVKVVQRMLGHASATLTLDRYGHLFGDELDTVAERLDVHRADSLRTRRGLGSVSGIGGEAEKAV